VRHFQQVLPFSLRLAALAGAGWFGVLQRKEASVLAALNLAVSRVFALQVALKMISGVF
jgi:hypothetical protein